MRRKLFNLVTAISMALCVVMVALWVRSYRHSDFIYCRVSKATLMPVTSPEQAAAWDKLKKTKGWEGMYTFRYVASACSEGSWFFFWGKESELVSDRNLPPPRARSGTNCENLLLVDRSRPLRVFVGLASSNANYAGFSYLRLSIGAGSDTRRVGIPLWAAFLLMLGLPTACVWKWLSIRRRVRVGFCPSCGYDLRATPQRCPECGRLADSAAL